MRHLFFQERLLRTEITTLIGLMVKAAIDFTPPRPDVLEQYVERSDRLLADLHHAMSQQAFRPDESRRGLSSE
jgi:hypothetical protein